MKISVCYIQHNRIDFLLDSLAKLELQKYKDVEVVISDDASTDETEKEILNIKKNYKFPILYSRSTINLGYDRNFRRSLELATGEYCITLGNDDAIVGEDALVKLAAFIEKNHYPEVGFANYFEYSSPEVIVERASQTGVIGFGKRVAIQYYNCFSFVGGLIFKKTAFEKNNTNRFDGSIYAQIYICTTIVLNGGRLFSVSDPIIGKDIILDRKIANSYRDKISRNWTKIQKVDGGLPSVMNVMISALFDSHQGNEKDYYHIFKKIYCRTFPYWILDYKFNKATPQAIGLIWGLFPAYNPNFKKLNYQHSVLIYFLYMCFGTGALFFPSRIFFKYKHILYAYLNK